MPIETDSKIPSKILELLKEIEFKPEELYKDKFNRHGLPKHLFHNEKTHDTSINSSNTDSNISNYNVPSINK